MLTRQRAKPLRLQLDRKTITFATLDDLAFALASRTEVPARKVAELMRLPDDALRREADAIREISGRFVDMVVDAQGDDATLGNLLSTLDPKLFSQDHGWRTIMNAMRRQPALYDEFKKVALIKYLQYLSARQSVLQSVHTERQRQGRSPPGPRADEPPGEAPSRKDTLAFQIGQLDAVSRRHKTFVRLPKGEVVTVPLRERLSLDLLLSTHRFKLLTGPPCRLVDQAGTSYGLRPGRNLIGRDTSNDVVLDDRYRDISRRHLVLDLEGEDVVSLTDLSSHGTSLGPRPVEFDSDTE